MNWYSCCGHKCVYNYNDIRTNWTVFWSRKKIKKVLNLCLMKTIKQHHQFLVIFFFLARQIKAWKSCLFKQFFWAVFCTTNIGGSFNWRYLKPWRRMFKMLLLRRFVLFSCHFGFANYCKYRLCFVKSILKCRSLMARNVW